MIASAADYHFVDFQNGDLPSDRINGNVMPLRTPGASVEPQEMLKAEDIAFLYEGMRDKIGAMMGAKKNGTDVETSVYPGSASQPRGHSYGPGPVAIPLTKKISSSQMQDLCYYIEHSAESGTTGVRFVTTPLSAVATSWQATDGSLPTRTHITQVTNGVTPTLDRTDFAVGKPVAVAPLYDAQNGTGLFNDMKLFDKPIWFAGTVIAGIPLSSFVVTGGGAYPQDKYQTIYYGMNSSDNPDHTENDYYVHNVPGVAEVLSIPLAYVKDPIKLWMRYGAYNSYTVTDPSSPSGARNVHDARTGMMEVTSFFTSLDQNGMRHYATTPTGSMNLKSAIESLYGWTEYAPDPSGQYRDQIVNVTFFDDFIVEFTPNGRTKWW